MPKKPLQKPLFFETHFIEGVFENHLSNKTHLDTKINWLAGLSALVMSLTFSYIFELHHHPEYLGLVIACIGSFLTLLICLFTYDVPHLFLPKSQSRDNIMFHRNLYGKSPKEIMSLFKQLESYDAVLEQYVLNFYSLINRNIKIKNWLFVLARTIFLGALILGAILLVVYV